MRRASIRTTMGYYADLQGADIADQLWSAWGAGAAGSLDSGNASGNNRLFKPLGIGQDRCHKSFCPSHFGRVAE